MYHVLGIIRFNIEEKVKETNDNSLTFQTFQASTFRCKNFRSISTNVLCLASVPRLCHRAQLASRHPVSMYSQAPERVGYRSAPPPPPSLLSSGAPTLVRRAAPSQARSSRARFKPERCVTATNSGAQTGVRRQR